MTTFSANQLAYSIGKRFIVKEISLTVTQGQITGLLGPNGAGKTTSFCMMVGLLRPTLGTTHLDRKDITHMPYYRRAKLGIGYLPQEGSVFRGLSVRANILAMLETGTSHSRKKRQEILAKLLQDFALESIADNLGSELSGGERRRVEVARALGLNPLFMLLDEPFAGVDPLAIGDMKTLITDLKKRGIGVLITDHNVRDTLDICDTAAIVNEGQILVHGRPEELLADDRARQVYFGDSFNL